MVWSVGASTNLAGREKFNSFLSVKQHDAPVSDMWSPAEGTYYDYSYDTKEEKWVRWMSTVQEFKVNKEAEFSDIIVPTRDSIRYTALLSLLVNNNHHVLFTGDTGTGKSVNVNNFLGTMPDKLQPISMIFSAATSANATQDFLFDKMDRRQMRCYGPPLGKRFVIFVDDMNMPAQEKYFAQPPIELLRQWMDHGTWYDRLSPDKESNQIIDIAFVAAMGPPGGGRNPVTARFLRHFNQIAHTELDHESLGLIFGTILKARLSTFSEDVQKMTEATVRATIDVYSTIREELLPTPSKSHYTFNLRDLSKVFQGMLSANPRSVTSVDSFLRLWVHENSRVFRDRLINSQDCEWLDQKLSSTMRKEFAKSWEDVVPGHLMLFGDFISNAETGIGKYDELDDFKSLVRVMEEAQSSYGDQYPSLGLVLFRDAVSHVARIGRILRQPQGNALLLGVGGSGRQSLTKLAAFMSDYQIRQIEVTKGFGPAEWREFLKNMLYYAGVKAREDEGTVLLFSDTQIVEESFLEDVNNLLNSGDVPGLAALYSEEERVDLMNAGKEMCRRKNLPVTPQNMYAQYIQRVRSNLHIVVTMSPLSDAFRTRLRMFPALVNCCTIDWFSAWPSEALGSVALSALKEEDLALGDHTPAVVQMFEFMHQTVEAKSVEYRQHLRRVNYVTPTSFLELLSMFKLLLKEKRVKVGDLRAKLQNGLSTLENAEVEVGEMRTQLKELMPKVKQKQVEVEEKKVQIKEQTRQVEAMKEVVDKQAKEAEAKAVESKALSDHAQADLSKALPLLDEAVACVRDLKTSDLTVVGSLLRPPNVIKTTMEAACVLFGVPPVKKRDPKTGQMELDYWDASKKELLSDVRALLKRLQDYDKDNIPEKIIKAMGPYIENPDLEVSVVEKASAACKAIAMWIHAMYKYHHVAKRVEPLREEAKRAEEQLAIQQAALNEAKARLDDVTNKMKGLAQALEDAMKEAQDTQDKVDHYKLLMQRANILIGGLGGEKVRWTTTIKSLGVDYDNILGDVLVSAGAIAYLGAFTSQYRSAMVNAWREKLQFLGITHTEGCDPRTTLADPVMVQGWTSLHGLPSDNTSVENAIFMDKARRWPLLIDPQGQAAKFVKHMGEGSNKEGIVVIKETDSDFANTIKRAIKLGRWVLVEGAKEKLSPVLDPILAKSITVVGGQAKIKLGDEDVDYDKNFRLFVCTTLPNPHFAPELQVKVTLLNFTITPSGLEDQMLGVVVAKESPEMESKKSLLLEQKANMSKQLQDIEDEILKLLYGVKESGSSPLENPQLIDTLANSKRTAAEIEERVKESEIVEVDIDKNRQAYRPVAKRASVLFFTIADLAMVDPMYQYSLHWFVQLFVGAISKAPKGANVDERLENLNNYFTESLYQNVCRSLFAEHKTLLSFLLTVRIMQADERVDSAEWRYLVAGAVASAEDGDEMKNPAPQWLTEDSWRSLVGLSALPRFEGFLDDFVQPGTLSRFRRYFDSATPEKESLPHPWNEKLDSMQKLIILKCLRPDKVVGAVKLFVAEHMGESYNEAPAFDLTISFEASSATIPLVFVLSRGADPTQDLLAFAKERGMDGDRMNSISLGQGQGEKAKKAMVKAWQTGGWVLLQNCHLAVSWLPELERMCADLKADEIDPSYRLWLTSMPTEKFPVSLLQNSVKMTNEPPKGLRANLKRSYMGFGHSLPFTNEWFDSSRNPTAFKKLLFGLCFFHALILDRRKFGALGWNILYDFTEDDLRVCITQLREFVDLYEEIPYQVIHFLTYDINYGGRVTDDVDRRTIRTILDDFVNPNVMDDEYSFSESGKYMSIHAGAKEAYMSYINDMDPVPEPEVFGLHSNADITSAQETTIKLFSTILGLLPRTAGGAGMSRDEQLESIAKSTLNRLPLEFDLDSIRRKYPTVYEESMNTVLIQEAIRYNKLLAVMKKTLSDLLKALKGLMVMTQTLERMADSLYNNAVPDNWAAVAYPSLMPLGAWTDDLVKRLAFVQQWVAEGVPTVFWISGFFFPQAFLTGSLQNFARKHVKPIDTVSFGFEVLKTPLEDIREPPEDGIYVNGLFLEGARYDPDQDSLVDSRPKELFTSLPVMWLKPEADRKDDSKEDPDGHVYKCPVYKILTRQGQLSTTGHSTNFVVHMELPTKEPAKKWIKAGVALFCSLRY